MSGRIIVFRAKNNKTQQRVVLSPNPDKTGKLWTGQGKDGYYESLTENVKADMPYVVTGQTKVGIIDGKVLNLDNPIDAANWKWISGNMEDEDKDKRRSPHPYIVLDKALMGSSRTAVFYVENKQRDAEKRVSSRKLIDKARFLIQYEFSHEQNMRIAKVMGHPSPAVFSPVELQDYLLGIAEVTPDIILNTADPKNAEDSGVKAAYHDLVKFKVIEKFPGQIWRYGGADGTAVGRNQSQIEDFIKNKKNEDIVGLMFQTLERVEKEQTSSVSV